MNRRNPFHRGVWSLAFVTVVWAIVCVVLPLSCAAAQDGKAEKNAPAAATPAPASTPETEAKPPESKSLLVWLIVTSGLDWGRAAGPVDLFVAKVVHMFTELRPEVAAPPEILQQCENLLKHEGFHGGLQAGQGGRLVFQLRTDGRPGRIAAGPGRGPRRDGTRWRDVGCGDGEEDQHAGRDRIAGADDRPLGDAQRHDLQFQRHRHVGHAIEAPARWPAESPSR